jgi:response regulator RpfG family c-di-GMP phosphodiesterase
MPGMDGREVCRRLQADPATRGIPIIFISAFSDSSERAEGLKLGAVDSVTKPILREELSARVNLQLKLLRVQADLSARAAQLEAANQRLQRETDERLAVEQRLQAAEARLQQSRHQEAIGRLAGGIAHQFNNILQLIIEQAELLESVGPDPVLAAGLRRILDQAFHAADLTRDLLACRLEAAVAFEHLDLRSPGDDG